MPVMDQDEGPPDRYDLFTIVEAQFVTNIRSRTTEELFIFDATVMGHSVKILVDTGATGVYLSSEFRKFTKLPLDTDKVQEVELANGNRLRSVGSTRVPIKVDNWNKVVDCVVLEMQGFDIILGCNSYSKREQQ